MSWWKEASPLTWFKVTSHDVFLHTRPSMSKIKGRPWHEAICTLHEYPVSQDSGKPFWWCILIVVICFVQDQQNVVVVQQPQTSFVTADVHPQRRPELGLGAAIFAIISTIFIASFGCWWALPCTVVGIILGITVSSGVEYKASVLKGSRYSYRSEYYRMATNWLQGMNMLAPAKASTVEPLNVDTFAVFHTEGGLPPPQRSDLPPQE